VLWLYLKKDGENFHSLASNINDPEAKTQDKDQHYWKIYFHDITRVTYLLMYSALSTLLHTLHLKQPRCQCLSKATRDCSFLNSFPQPQQSAQKTDRWREVNSYLMRNDAKLDSIKMDEIFLCKYKSNNECIGFLRVKYILRKYWFKGPNSLRFDSGSKICL